MNVRTIPDTELRATQDKKGKWHALDANGKGHKLFYASHAEVQAWLDGYFKGQRSRLTSTLSLVVLLACGLVVWAAVEGKL